MPASPVQTPPDMVASVSPSARSHAGVRKHAHRVEARMAGIHRFHLDDALPRATGALTFFFFLNDLTCGEL
jgi:hypothetical protein